MEANDLLGWLLALVLGSMAVGMILFLVWGIKEIFLQPPQNYYEECVMRAVDKYQASADILAICKELK